MAKKVPIKPIFPLKHEFVASMDRFIHEAGMLADTIKQLVSLGKLDGATKGIIEERLAAFEDARFGDE